MCRSAGASTNTGSQLLDRLLLACEPYLMKILITRALPKAVLDRARSHFDVTLREGLVPMQPEDIRTALAEYDAILPTLGDKFTADTFIDAPRTRIIANFGVGYNHIDVDAARGAGITVTNTPDTVTDATADIALTLLLMTARRAGEGERVLRAGDWHGWQPTQMLGTHVTGKTVAIIGMGRIGQAIAKRCHFGFGMEIVFYNRTKGKSVDLPAREISDLKDTVAVADFVIAAVPGGGANTNLIDADVLAAMKPTAHFINIARGDIVDEDALIAALESGGIAGAGLDVYAKEPLVPAKLVALENVALLPHLGTAALEVREAMGMMALENIIAVLSGEKPANPVT